MKRWLLFLVCATLVLAGCSVNEQFVSAVDKAWVTIGPEYRAYVEADEAIGDDTKATRLRTAEILTETIEVAKQQ